MKDMPLIPRRPSCRRCRATITGVNWVGLQTLYLREVRRFWKVGMQTLAAPVVTALLYMLVFVVGGAGRGPPVHGVAYRRLRGARPDHDADPEQRLRQLLLVAAAGQDERA